ncbi:MAG: hypothetical protein NZM35_11710 [Chitinophagales bacterium]|nr:hypothetical protein [Chitinophagales bacterium]MDW8419253.1 hypothetical protein [Chitinophagales bacterium]
MHPPALRSFRQTSHFLLLTGMLILTSTCTKYDDKLITGNVPPPDGTIDSATILLYIHRTYVHVIGREPLNTELQQARQLLSQNNFSTDDRKQYLDQLLAKPEYYRNQYNTSRGEYLQQYDSLDFETQLFIFNQLLQQPEYAPFYGLIQHEINRLNAIKNALNDLSNGTLDHKGMLRRMVDNYFYDQINMGTENFVISTFQHFLFRYPTASELSNAKTMVDGNTAVLFLQFGKNKNDYLNIFFNTPDFYEGQVRYVYRKYLYRDATPAEMAHYGKMYRETGNYKVLLREVLSLPEFAGL